MFEIMKVPESEIEQCGRAIALYGGEDSERVEELRAHIHPTLRKLRGGAALEGQILRLVANGDKDRARKLLQAHGRMRGLPLPRGLRGVSVPAILGIAIVPLAGQFMPRCDGGYELAMNALNSCPQAVEALGSPIEQSLLGYACGSSETRGGGFGNAQWMMRVNGPLGSGTFQYAAESHGGNWQLVRAALDTDSGTVRVWPCAGAATTWTDDPGRYERLRSGFEWRGQIVEISGDAPIAEPTRCEVLVSPAADEFRERGFNCQVKVRCGEHVIYGWEGAGVTRCDTNGARLTGVLDDTGAAENDDPMLEVDLEQRRAIVSDNGDDATYRIVIQLER